MSDSNAPWIDVCKVSELPSSGGKFVEHKNNMLAVFKLADGQVKIIDDICPHAGGSLASGWINQGCVFCPLHAWPFKLENGENPDNPSIKVKAYPARVVDGVVQTQV